MTPDKVTASHHDSSLAQTPPSHKEIHNVGLMTVECFLGVSQVSSISCDELELHVTVLGIVEDAWLTVEPLLKDTWLIRTLD